jgi:hypothetical protein
MSVARRILLISSTLGAALASPPASNTMPHAAGRAR